MYIVTGGAGFIGSALVAELNDAGIKDILIVDHLQSSNKWENLIHKEFSDIVTQEVFQNLFRKDGFTKEVKAIFHLGACSSTTEQDAQFLLENNFHYTRELAEWALGRGVRFIYASSGATYGDGSLGFSDDDETTEKLRPLNMYGFSKQLFDLWALRSGNIHKMTGLKFFNVYGPNEYHKNDMASVVFKAYDQILTTGKLKLFKSYNPNFKDGEQQRDFVYVKDTTRLMLWLANNPQATGIFNVGSGKARTWNDLAKATFAAMNKPVNIEYIDMPEFIRDRYQYMTESKMGKLATVGYTTPPTSLEDGVTDYVRNYLSQKERHW